MDSIPFAGSSPIRNTEHIDYQYITGKKHLITKGFKPFQPPLLQSESGIVKLADKPVVLAFNYKRCSKQDTYHLNLSFWFRHDI